MNGRHAQPRSRVRGAVAGAAAILVAGGVVWVGSLGDGGKPAGAKGSRPAADCCDGGTATAPGKPAKGELAAVDEMVPRRSGPSPTPPPVRLRRGRPRTEPEPTRRSARPDTGTSRPTGRKDEPGSGGTGSPGTGTPTGTGTATPEAGKS
ncbi:hypothetical protein [Actinomadura nitritigenes]|uniref:hypothetical protein n=1 Tax=Actinomadura nitritigenes TaxID=134602 RepID=UPI003D92A504